MVELDADALFLLFENVLKFAGVDPEDDRLNPYGGAIACGHPLAATGVRLMAQLAYGFKERPHVRYGLTALCVGMGMGAALLWENLDAGH